MHLVGRSFKYHRPRGILSAGSEEPNALVTVDRGAGRITPNLRATQVELYDGLVARSQNRYPSLRFDLGALAGLAAPLLSAGFYYKTFMWPPSFWRRLYEPAIRRAAGLGERPASRTRIAICSSTRIATSRSSAAARRGWRRHWAPRLPAQRVILCDEQAELGGSLLDEPTVTIDGWPAPDWLREAIGTLGGSVTLLPRTTAFGWYPDNLIGLAAAGDGSSCRSGPGLPSERLWHVRAGRVVLATGAIERPLVFPGNDRPGVMLAGAARTYLHRYGVKVGRAWWSRPPMTAPTAPRPICTRRASRSPAIVDQRPHPDSEAVEAARALGIPIQTGMTIASTEGRRRVHSAKLTNGNDVVPCDTVLMSGGWTPSVHLAQPVARRPVFDPPSGNFLPSEGARRGVRRCVRSRHLPARWHRGRRQRAASFSVAGLPAMAPSGPPVPAAAHR